MDPANHVRCASISRFPRLSSTAPTSPSQRSFPDACSRPAHVGNKGNGPAIVQNVRVLVDGKPVTDWAGVYRNLGLASDAHPGYSSLNQSVLAPGDDSVYLQPADRATFEALRRLADTRWVLEACYCSALDECWIAQAHPRRAADITRETDACPATDPARDFID